ncbi:MAG: hypothetical protein PHN88_10395 [Ignavibacteria bacterium]|nr:hypothetical protein [Ignavibacteria bacterium]
MKYLITIAILFFVCINLNAQGAAGNDDKASGATVGQGNGYSYEFTYTIVDGNVLEQGADKSIIEKINKVDLKSGGKAFRDDKPAGKDGKNVLKYSYEVTYSISNGIVSQ